MGIRAQNLLAINDLDKSFVLVEKQIMRLSNFFEKLPTSRIAANNLRSHWIPKAHGLVAEIGFGSGSNLPYYGCGVRELMAIDRDLGVEMQAKVENAETRFPIMFLKSNAERLPLAGGVLDCVVSTWTLCSVKSTQSVLKEALRILKPGGNLLFIEHGYSKDARVRNFQDLWTPIQRVIADGCHLNRLIPTEITQAGFEILECDQMYLNGIKGFSYVSAGIARKPQA